MEPMVSICCAAYNHAPYIAQALESFLAQDVPIEILVHDDASTDGTQDILRDYARRYPDVVRPLFETENQYSRGVAIDPTFNYPARGASTSPCARGTTAGVTRTSCVARWTTWRRTRTAPSASPTA